MKTFFALPLLITLFSLTGISTSGLAERNDRGNRSPFADSAQWKLIVLRDANQLDTLVSSRAFIRFDAAKGSVGGNGGCNSFGGSLKVDNNRIHIDRIFSTKMYCMDVQQKEDQFFQLLQQVDNWHLNESQLTLSQGDKTLLIFQRN